MLRRLQYILLATLIFNITYAQIPSNCFEIESVLADACGSPEGENEMVRLKIGPSDLMVADMIVDWPNNNFLGFCQNTGTANVISQLNATIQGCGWLVEPTGGVLPSGSDVLLVTSENINPAANSFTNLNDTLIVLFQCAGNTTGHFSNSASTPRTLIIDFTSPANCGDTVSYLGTSLIGGNGGRVDYDWNNNPTYVNDGCQAPFFTATVDIGAVSINGQTNGVLCPGGVAEIDAVALGNYDEIVWTSGGQGTFQFNDTTASVYQSSINDTIPFYLYVGLIGPCADTLQDSVIVNIQPEGMVSVTPSSVDLCPGDSVLLTASGGVDYLWNTGANSNTIYAQAGNYSVAIDDGCYIQNVQATITDNLPLPNITVNGDTILCGNGDLAMLNAMSTDNILWSTGDINASISVGATGLYFAVASNSCGTDTGFIEVFDQSVQAGVLASSDTVGFAPLDVVLNSNSNNEQYYQWIYNGNTIGSNNVNTSQWTEVGSFEVIHVVSNDFGCFDSTLITITTLPVLDYPVPNVFTPNGDSENDQYVFENDWIQEIKGSIFNRWGQLMFQNTSSIFSWDGTTMEGVDCPDGTYFGVFEVTLINGETETKETSIMLMR